MNIEKIPMWVLEGYNTISEDWVEFEIFYDRYDAVRKWAITKYGEQYSEIRIRKIIKNIKVIE